MNARVGIRELHARGREQWPDLDLSFDAFASHCERVHASENAHEHGGDLYLCCACVARHPTAMAIVERRAADTVRSAISRVNRSPEFVQETLQDFWERTLGGPEPKIAEYGARGPLNAWLRVSAVHYALDSIRSQQARAKRRQTLDEALASDALGAEAAVIRQRYAAEFQGALERAVAALSPRERTILRMQLQGGCTIDDIGRAYNKHRATAARWLERARDKVFEFVHAELSRHHAGLTPAELRSIGRVLGSVLLLKLSETPGAPDGEA